MRLRGLFGRLASGIRSLRTRTIFLILLLLSCTSLLFTIFIYPDAIDTTTTKAYSAANAAKKYLPTELPKNLPKLPKFGWGSGARKPPASVNSTASAATYYSHWNWRHPFSSSVSKDEDRIVLPPLARRCPVYTYYDPKAPDAATVKPLITEWRRAYWAYGFKPTVIGPKEAEADTFYEQLAKKEELSAELEGEVKRWLAWHHMKGGVLVDYRLIPMGDYDAPTLTKMRRCQFARMSRLEDWPGAYYAGEQKHVEDVLKYVLFKPLANGTTTMEDATRDTRDERERDVQELFHVEPRAPSLAYYSKETVKKLYPELKEEDLPALIGSHLHKTFLARYPDGISVLTPSPHNGKAVAQAVLPLANSLAQCPIGPLPSSCPPNRQKCSKCVSKEITLIKHIPKNYNDTFMVSVVPHPHTFLSVKEGTTEFSPAYVRRQTFRDIWVKQVTPHITNPDFGAPRLALELKTLVPDAQHSYWTVADDTMDLDLTRFEWRFGFKLPTPKMDVETETLKGQDAARYEMLKRSVEIIGKREEEGIVSVIEAWNLADSEVWKFVKALGRRAKKELEEWEEEERQWFKED